MYLVILLDHVFGILLNLVPWDFVGSCALRFCWTMYFGILLDNVPWDSVLSCTLLFWNHFLQTPDKLPSAPTLNREYTRVIITIS